MTIIETGADDLETQIKHWQLNRKINVLMYYGRKEGLKNFGLQTLPALQVSEYNAKVAINLVLLLKSIAKSSFRTEKWTLLETSAELIFTAPKNCFKKKAYQVWVLYDDEESNAILYTNWDRIYYQDANDMWQVSPGMVDHNGLYFDDNAGERNYFQLFAPDAEKYGKTGKWTVKYKTKTISSVVTSSTKSSTSGLPERDTTNATATAGKEVPVRRAKSPGRQSPHHPSTSSELGRLLSRKRQGEPSTRGHSDRKRHRQQKPPSPTAGEVGVRHTTVQTTGLTRLGRLIEEARDPPILIVKGSSNQLKCWRFRFQHKCGHLFQTCSSVFKWIDDTNNAGSRMLIAFRNTKQRQQFINCVKFPRGTSYGFGALDTL